MTTSHPLNGSHTNTKLLFWCQQEFGNNVNGNPVFKSCQGKITHWKFQFFTCGKDVNKARPNPSLYWDGPAGAPHGLQVRALDADQAVELKRSYGSAVWTNHRHNQATFQGEIMIEHHLIRNGERGCVNSHPWLGSWITQPRGNLCLFHHPCRVNVQK